VILDKPGSYVIILSGLLAIVTVAAAAPAKLEVCAECHGEDGSGAGFDNVPIIAGTPAAHLEEAIYAYQDGARRCAIEPKMCETVAELSADEIIELAEHFAALRRLSSGEPFDASLAVAGERLHEEHCAICHVLPEAEDVADAIGIPLHGQRSEYLRLALDAYFNGDRDTLVEKMEEKLELLDAADFEALINYYASYSP